MRSNAKPRTGLKVPQEPSRLGAGNPILVEPIRPSQTLPSAGLELTKFPTQIRRAAKPADPLSIRACGSLAHGIGDIIHAQACAVG